MTRSYRLKVRDNSTFGGDFPSDCDVDLTDDRIASIQRYARIIQSLVASCTCPVLCDCEAPGIGLKSQECPIHNVCPRPALTCPVHGESQLTK